MPDEKTPESEAVQAALRDQIIARIGERAPNLKPCSVCGEGPNYQISTGLVLLFNQDYGPETSAPLGNGGRAMPTTALICNICGNTQLLNLNVLGLPELTRRGIPDEIPQESSTPIPQDVSGN